MDDYRVNRDSRWRAMDFGPNTYPSESIISRGQLELETNSG